MRIDSRGSTPSWIGSSLPFPVEKNDKGRRWNTDLYGGKADEDRGKAKENTSTTFQSKSFPIQKPNETTSFFSTCKVTTQRESSELSACR